jgi:BirA family transcriptional regulator, biotin operon repressor / biotin---[acetyl-CoA-carboxylase] ligase
MIIGRKLIEKEATGSTNDLAESLLRQGHLPEGTVIAASYQTGGKGQGSHTWYSEKGKNLLLSVILQPSYLEARDQFLVSMFVSLGIRDMLMEMTENINVEIKWPNDIIAEKKKIAGILINNAISGRYLSRSIIGIGLNVNQENFPAEAGDPVSLKMLTLKEHELSGCRRHLFDSLNKRLVQITCSPGRLKEDYLGSLHRYRKMANYEISKRIIEAMITGVDEFGRLCLISKGGEEFVCDIKEVRYL